jgi:hypothetical protein
MVRLKSSTRKPKKLPAPPVVITATVFRASRVAQAASNLKKDDLRIFHQNTGVPSPNVTVLQPAKRPKTLKANVWRKRLLNRINRDVGNWRKNVPIYRLQGVHLASLQARPKNSHKEEAQRVIDEMQDWESDGGSGLFQDDDGNTLVAYFARRRNTNDDEVSHQ